MKKILLGILAAASLAGCATKPTAEEFARADFGTYPDNWEQIIKDFAGSQLKDPYSAQYRFFNQPVRGFMGIGGAQYGWVVCGTINAKNSYGGYTGSRISYFMIRDGRILNSTIGDGSYGNAMAEGKCKGTGIYPN